MFLASKIKGMAFPVSLLLAILVVLAAQGCNRSRDDAQARQFATRVRFETKPMLAAPMATHDLGRAEFRDSENNVLAIMCEKPKAAKS